MAIVLHEENNLAEGLDPRLNNFERELGEKVEFPKYVSENVVRLLMRNGWEVYQPEGNLLTTKPRIHFRDDHDKDMETWWDVLCAVVEVGSAQ